MVQTTIARGIIKTSLTHLRIKVVLNSRSAVFYPVSTECAFLPCGHTAQGSRVYVFLKKSAQSPALPIVGLIDVVGLQSSKHSFRSSACF